ncbi:Trehalase [Meloidogyne graminicola]|uniref:Trehalase n=1 Tax=Meloidogyne graminicola TaxID=189291 RepID=A0A8S9ZYI1_9BILA|nr:Trehalase [Meloidogyne graminicola]
MKFDASIVQEEFNKLFPKKIKIKEIDPKKLQNFINKYFDNPMSNTTALKSCTKIKGFQPKPVTLAAIKDDLMRQWAFELNERWKELCVYIPNKGNNPKRNSLVYVPNNVIRPGARFREVYYWDSYWTIKGLIASELPELVKGMIKNFAIMIDNYGFVLNGGRNYYLARSQPPFLTPMVNEYYKYTGDKQFLIEILPTLEKELNFWLVNRSIEVTKNFKNYTMYQYRAESTVPRPESFCSDVRTAIKSNEKNKAKLWQNLASAAESGMDFSSRWMRNYDNPKLEEIITTSIIPLDLNAFICGNFRLLSELYSSLGKKRKALTYNKLYLKMRSDFKEFFLYTEDEKKFGWYDYNIETKNQNIHYYSIMAIPLFTQCYDPKKDSDIPEKIFNTMKNYGVFEKANGADDFYGVQISLKYSGQQWDGPNLWPNHEHMAVLGFLNSGKENLKNEALYLAKKWLLANYRLYSECIEKQMWEKLSAKGKEGKGGEYVPQLGFGWTNGVVLDFLKIFNEQIKFNSTELLNIKPKKCF